MRTLDLDLDTNVNTRVSRADKQRLRNLASRRGVTLSDLLREQVQKLVEQVAA